jgi:hypothetical protein
LFEASAELTERSEIKKRESASEVGMEWNGMSRSKDERIKMKMGRSPRPEWWRPKRIPVRVK